MKGMEAHGIATAATCSNPCVGQIPHQRLMKCQYLRFTYMVAHSRGYIARLPGDFARTIDRGAAANCGSWRRAQRPSTMEAIRATLSPRTTARVAREWRSPQVVDANKY